MPKVYFRVESGKAISKDITSDVNYNQVVQAVASNFKLQTSNIKLVYNGWTQTGDFKLSEQLPHHIVHVHDKSTENKQIKVSVTVNSDKGTREIRNLAVNADTKVKDFIKDLYQTEKLNKVKSPVEHTELYHGGVKLNDNETFLDRGVENNANLNIQLKDDYPDPADVPLCSAELAGTVSPLIMGLQMMPKYYTLSTQITALNNASFFLHFQQRYEGNRINKVYSDYDPYRYPASPQAEPEEEEEVVEQQE